MPSHILLLPPFENIQDFCSFLPFPDITEARNNMQLAQRDNLPPPLF
jgi:hypothetical protein